MARRSRVAARIAQYQREVERRTRAEARLRLRAAREEKRARRALERSAAACTTKEAPVSPEWFFADLEARLEAIADRLDALSRTALAAGANLGPRESNVRPIVTRLRPSLAPAGEAAHRAQLASTG